MAKGSDSSDSIPTVWYPIVADPDRAISARLGILDPDELDPQGSSLAARSVLILGPDKKLKASILYPASTGRNFAEILRVIDSLQLTARYSVATPVDWSHGRPCMVLPTLSDASARDKLPKGFCTIPVPSGKPYLRLTPQPDL
jgi:1-Cys peroxiredoxin 6